MQISGRAFYVRGSGWAGYGKRFIDRLSRRIDQFL